MAKIIADFIVESSKEELQKIIEKILPQFGKVSIKNDYYLITSGLGLVTKPVEIKIKLIDQNNGINVLIENSRFGTGGFQDDKIRGKFAEIQKQILLEIKKLNRLKKKNKEV